MSDGARSRAGAHPISVLVIDDDLEIREIIEEVLRERGYTVAVAKHGAEALAVLETNIPQLILLDLNMPVMSGQEFREAQRRDPTLAEIPTVVMSAVDRMRELVVELAPTEALAKPVKLRELLATVERHAQ